MEKDLQGNRIYVSKFPNMVGDLVCTYVRYNANDDPGADVDSDHQDAESIAVYWPRVASIEAECLTNRARPSFSRHRVEGSRFRIFVLRSMAKGEAIL